MFMRTGLVSMIMLAGSYWVFFYEQSSGASIAQPHRRGEHGRRRRQCLPHQLPQPCASSILSIGWFSNPYLWLGIG
jgi:cation-transporting P-type ATPase F